MSTSRWGRGRSMMHAALGLAAAGLMAGAVQADTQPPGEKPAERTTILSFEHLELDKLLTDPRDAGVKRALMMIPDRLRELPSEVRDFRHVPPDAFALLGKLFGRHLRMGLSYDAENQGGGFFGFGLVWSVRAADEKDAAGMHAHIMNLLGGGRGGDGPPISPSPTAAGMMQFETPAGVILFGPRKAESGWVYEVRLGETDATRLFKTLDAVKVPGGSVLARATFDLSPLTPLAEMLANAAGGEGERFLRKMTEGGAIGPDAVRYEMAWASTDDGFRSVSRGIGAGKIAARQNARLALTEGDLKLMPADTVIGFTAKYPFAAMVKEIEELVDADPEAQRFIERFKREMGFDLVDDVLKSFGDVVSVYMSDSTGGGGLGSLAGVIGLSNASKFASVMDKMVESFNAEMKRPRAADGYVRIRAWGDGGQKFYTLQTPGLPLPVEVTVCVTQGHLVFGLTQQACVAAVAQATGKGDGGLMAGGGKGLFPADKQLSMVSFTDTPRLGKRGYPMVAMVGAAMANAVRSRSGDRDPGVIVPSYGVLFKGVRPAVSYSYWEGDDSVSITTGDRSMLVNFAGAFGALSEFAPMFALAAAGMATAMAERSVQRVPYRPPPPPPDDPDAGSKKPNFMIIPRRGALAPAGGSLLDGEE